MKLFLEVEIGERLEGNESLSLLHFASSLASDLLGTGIGNVSDTEVVEMVLRLIEPSTSVFVLITINDPIAPIGKVDQLLNRLNHLQKPVTLLLSRGHDTMELILKQRGFHFIREDDITEIRKRIHDFAQ